MNKVWKEFLEETYSVFHVEDYWLVYGKIF